MLGLKTKPAPKPQIRIKLNQSIGGQRTQREKDTGKLIVVGHFSHHSGAVLDWDEDEANRWIESGVASLASPGAELGIGIGEGSPPPMR